LGGVEFGTNVSGPLFVKVGFGLVNGAVSVFEKPCLKMMPEFSGFHLHLSFKNTMSYAVCIGHFKAKRQQHHHCGTRNTGD
jgi:hypothetical protein